MAECTALAHAQVKTKFIGIAVSSVSLMDHVHCTYASRVNVLGQKDDTKFKLQHPSNLSALAYKTWAATACYATAFTDHP